MALEFFFFESGDFALIAVSEPDATRGDLADMSGGPAEISITGGLE